MPSPSSSSRGNETPKARGGRVAKRSCNACARCRRQKIKCSGTQPCEACKKRRLACDFDERDQKIMVTKGYILDLQDQIQNRRESTAAPRETSQNAVDDRGRFRIEDDDDDPVTLSSLRRSTRRRGGDAHPVQDEQHDQAPSITHDPVASSLQNALALGPSQFMKARDGRPFYLGTSSNWSFTRRVLNLAHEFVHQSPVSPDSLLFDGTTYDLPWDGLRNTPCPDAPVLPSLDHALFLINSVKFHCAQIFHLFDEESFMPELYDFYANPEPQVMRATLFYIHLLLIMAFGKALVNQDNQQKKPPGCDFFSKALQLLPDVHILVKTPAISTEILCCVALYFQCLDHRNSAYNYVGQAMRLVMTNGLHTNMPVDQFGAQFVERCRRIWLTVYVMDREMTSLMGIPPSISNEDVYCELPNFSGSIQRQSALRMQIRVSHSIARINREVYGADGRLNKNFLTSTKDVLASVAGQADELRRTFPLPLDRYGLQGISRISAYLHLRYHQCIVLATRPLLFCFLKIHFESPETYIETLNSSATVANLMKLCVESSQQMIGILICLQDQGLLEKFLPHDLESLFVSTVNLILGPSLDPNLGENSRSWVDKAYELFGEFTQSGNLIAQLRRSELQQLDDMLSGLPWRAMPPNIDATANNNNNIEPPQQQQINRREEFAGMDVDTVMPHPEGDDNPFPTPLTGNFDDFGWDSGLTTAQMMDLANSIGSSDTEWMQHAMTEHSIW